MHKTSFAPALCSGPLRCEVLTSLPGPRRPVTGLCAALGAISRAGAWTSWVLLLPLLLRPCSGIHSTRPSQTAPARFLHWAQARGGCTTEGPAYASLTQTQVLFTSAALDQPLLDPAEEPGKYRGKRLNFCSQGTLVSLGKEDQSKNKGFTRPISQTGTLSPKERHPQELGDRHRIREPRTKCRPSSTALESY